VDGEEGQEYRPGPGHGPAEPAACSRGVRAAGQQGDGGADAS